MKLALHNTRNQHAYNHRSPPSLAARIVRSAQPQQLRATRTLAVTRHTHRYKPSLPSTSFQVTSTHTHATQIHAHAHTHSNVKSLMSYRNSGFPPWKRTLLQLTKDISKLWRRRTAVCCSIFKYVNKMYSAHATCPTQPTQLTTQIFWLAYHREIYCQYIMNSKQLWNRLLLRH